MQTRKPEGFDRFLSKVAAANRSKSRDVLLTVEEANDLHNAITTMLVRQNTLLEDIVNLQKSANVVQEISLSGGSFK